MALAAATVWEVRVSTGADTNGGGFVTGATGVDFSQQASPQYSVADAVTAGSTTITSATANFGTDVVGNILYIQGGTAPITAGWYQITSRTNSTTIVVDRSTGLSVGTGATLHIGGALATVAQVITNSVAGNTVYFKAEASYTQTTTQTIGLGSDGTSGNAWIGYTTTRTDNGRATITTATNTTILIRANAAKGYSFTNFLFSNTAGTSAAGIQGFNNQSFIMSFNNCKISGFTVGIDGNTSQNISLLTLENCEVTACTSHGIFVGGTLTLKDCFIHGNTGDGFRSSANGIGSYIFINTIFYANANGANIMTDQAPGSNSVVLISQFSCYVNNTAAGLVNAASVHANCNVLSNNIFYNNTTYGVSLGGTANQMLVNHNNAYGANGTAARNNMSAGSGDVTLSASPFTNAAGSDFSLNSTAGGGAALKSVGFPGVLAIGGTGYADIGTLRHQDPAGTSAIIAQRQMTGGFV